jgi:CRP-like cAMP-binding protein
MRKDYGNYLLKTMSSADLALIEPHLVEVRLDVPFRLEQASADIEFAYFLENGLASIVGTLPNGRDIEVGIAGRDGMTGAAIILGARQSPNVTFMQISGWGFRIPTERLLHAMEQSPSLKALLLLYVQSLLVQTTSTVLANGHVQTDGRLARWLLMVHDRVSGASIALTHEFLAVMLGVTRPGVTVALHALEGQKLIRTNRGQIVIVDREGLTRLTNGSYGAAEREYHRVIGVPLSR